MSMPCPVELSSRLKPQKSAYLSITFTSVVIVTAVDSVLAFGIKLLPLRVEYAKHDSGAESISSRGSIRSV